jgi:hypothetical protein
LGLTVSDQTVGNVLKRHGIAARYGRRTADLVAMQLKYPRERAPQ